MSFRQPGAATGAPVFVVDVWRREGNDWKLAIRYAASSATDAVPGVPAQDADLPKRY